jgi:hypothetical protein
VLASGTSINPAERSPQGETSGASEATVEH